jgi:isoprenylcysteine carboxyl methyltransferase (ICMT) family protein YpbQ
MMPMFLSANKYNVEYSEYRTVEHPESLANVIIIFMKLVLLVHIKILF